VFNVCVYSIAAGAWVIIPAYGFREEGESGNFFPGAFRRLRPAVRVGCSKIGQIFLWFGWPFFSAAEKPEKSKILGRQRGVTTGNERGRSVLGAISPRFAPEMRSSVVQNGARSASLPFFRGPVA
jgi:hypothetical protein